MKKKILIGTFFTICIVSIIAMIYAGITMNNNQKELDKHLIELNYEGLKQKIDNQDSFILVLTATTCSHCAMYKPTLKEVLKENNIYAYEILTDKITDKEEIAYLNSIASINGTPTTIFIENGEEKSTANRLVGNKSKVDIETRLKALGYIQ